MFSDWESIWLQYRWNDAFAYFRFIAAERPPPSDWTLLQFKPGDPCTVTLAQQPALTGLITDRQTSYDANRHQVQLVGKSNTHWGYKSSVDSPTGSFMGGAVADYEAWALAVPGVTRAWAAVEQGIGTITVRFLMDDLRASDDGWPTPSDIETVAAYIDEVRPVTVNGCYVLAPIKEFIDITIANLVPNTTEAQAEIEASIEQMPFRDGRAGSNDLFGVGQLRDHERAERAVVQSGNDRRLCDA